MFDEKVRRSWLAEGSLFAAEGSLFAAEGSLFAAEGSLFAAEGSLFAAETTRLALEGEKLLGIEIGFHGPEFRERQAALAPLWEGMLDEGIATQADVELVLERSDNAQWLNPMVHSGVHYVHALSVKPEAQGKRVGMHLLSHAMRTARTAGFKKLQLDVLSDNPAVNFYQSMGLELLVESRAPKPQEYGVPPEWRMGIDL